MIKIGEDDEKKQIKVPLADYLQYTKYNHDDSPIYCFDKNFSRNEESKGIQTDYNVPKFFEEDFFDFMQTRRPPFRWFLIGPKRSGTEVHQDPNGTSAWNTSLAGHKLWVLMSPYVEKTLA